MKRITMSLSLAALAVAGAAYAQQEMNPEHDAIFTRAEAQDHATKMFARMDVNSDGKLDPADHEARRTQMFDRIDTNKDSQISRDEFAAMHRPDGDKDGKRKDRHDGMRGHHRGPMHMMKMADTNKDGAVSQAEFTTASLTRFDKMDGNKDGKVTKEERKTARAAMRAKWHDRKDSADGPSTTAPES